MTIRATALTRTHDVVSIPRSLVGPAPLHIVGDNNDGGKLVYKYDLDVPDQTGLPEAHLCSITCAFCFYHLSEKSLFLSEAIGNYQLKNFGSKKMGVQASKMPK